jgi:hypothetical protein
MGRYMYMDVNLMSGMRRWTKVDEEEDEDACQAHCVVNEQRYGGYDMKVRYNRALSEL